jgi:hypothetical protein
MLSKVYSYLFNKKEILDKTIVVDNENLYQDDTIGEIKKLEDEIATNKNKYTVIRNYDRKTIKNIIILDSPCFDSFPCLHEVVIIFEDDTIDETTMNVLLIYEIWKNLSFKITPKFLEHCKREEEMFYDRKGDLESLKKLFTIKKDLLE